MKTLSEQDLARQDYVDNKIFETINALNLSSKPVEWNIEMIAEIRDGIQYWLVDYYSLCSERKFYPYLSTKTYATNNRRKNNRRYSLR